MKKKTTLAKRKRTATVLRAMLMFVALVGWGMTVASCVLPKWLDSEDEESFGFWHKCDSDMCVRIKDSRSSLGAARAFSILSIFTSTGLVVCGFLILCPAFKKNLVMLQIIPGIFGALIVECTIMTAAATDAFPINEAIQRTVYTYGAAFKVAVASAFVFACGLGVSMYLLFIMRKVLSTK